MLLPSPGAALLLTLAAGPTQAAEPSPVPRCAATARFDLSAESPERALDVCVSSDEPTTFYFDSRVAPGTVEFQPVGRLADWAPGQEGVSLTVTPKGDFLPGERVKVTVGFADGAAPTSASFWLVGHASKGTRRAEVFRQPRPPDVLKKERDEAQAEASQLREDKARLLAEREAPGGLMGAAWLERDGTIASKDIGEELRERQASALRLMAARSYSFTGSGESRPASLAVRLSLRNPGAESWTLAGAALVNSTGEELALAGWQGTPIATGPTGGVIVVGTERTPEQLGCPCTLKLWEATGPRTVTLGNVTFPGDKAKGP